MSQSRGYPSDDVEQILLNARLRDELEPFLDDSIAHFNEAGMPTAIENEFLASMLAWERAPALPISRWFDPELQLPAPESLDDATLHDKLWEVVQLLFDKRIVLDFTDHLSDRQLYTVIFRDILPCYEKYLPTGDHYLHWDCADQGGDPEVWLRFYADDEERDDWASQFGDELPPHESLPFPRSLPRGPL